MLPLLLYALLTGRSVAVILGLAAQLALGALLMVLPVPRGALLGVYSGVLLLLLAGGVAERELSRYGWQTSDKAGLWRALRPSDEVSGYGFGSWNARGVDAATLSLDVRLASGTPGWDWFRSDPRYILERQPGSDYPHTRVWVPTPSGDAPPYLMRTFDFREPLGGRIFRVLLELRRADRANTKGTSAAAPQDQVSLVGPGDPIGGRDCEGVSLQAWTYRGGGRCLPITLTNSWRRYSLSWRVPDEVEASVVRVVLSGFAGQTLDVRRVKLIGARRKLGPFMPQGGALTAVWGARPEAQSGRTFIPASEWRTVTANAVRGANAGDTLTASLQTASGLMLTTRNVTATAPDGTPLPRALSSTRQTILFGDPNLAGHTLGTLGLALVALAGPLAGGFGAALTLFGVALTGSRAALIGVAFGVVWLFWLRLPRGGRRVGSTLLGLCVVGLGAVRLGLVWPEGSALRLLSLSETTPRSDIWGAAWGAFLTHPWQGLGAGGFPAYWSEVHNGEAVQHAHNLWLEFATSYGILGLLSAFALTLGLSFLAWQRGGARALALVGGTLVMNVFDTTFFYSGVLFTLMLALGALKSPSGLVHLLLGRGAHNAGVAARFPQVPPK
ncbi:MAG: hypothetical protein AVDCRST_MAG86-4419 [uncultured Truepera sp.]|uniref:O-antigen ligase-related domain-containing protein n=1 Tax=uncultured Truepera sp. TaxID=543023 RepID=A0A6J4VUK3_9DEIN|nr:MAG: hypothetical protein AVDCRST_MAG86-4419 [uncultured Truepera sp.]